MSPELKALKDNYEEAYKVYTNAVASGNTNKAKKALKEFQSAKSAYESVLNSAK